MINGTIYSTTDIGIAMQSLGNCKVLYVGELNMNLPNGFIECSVLLPPYEAVSAAVDGDIPLFQDIYGSYLTFTEPCYGMIATILIALNRGVNILMYFENGDDMGYHNYLLKYIEDTYGITVGTEVHPFSYNHAFDWIVSSVLYSYMDGFIDEQEFILSQQNIPMLISLDQNHPYIKPIAKLVSKYPNINMDITSFILTYQNMIKSYGSIKPGSMITIGDE